jgi:hypothetical protein
VGPEGNCFPCPAEKPASQPGSTSVEACFPLHSNLFVSSTSKSQLAAYNHDDQSFSLLKEEGELESPQGIAFLNSSMLLIANTRDNNVLLVSVEGDVVDVFATVPKPMDVFYLNATKSVAVIYSIEGGLAEGIYFFSVDDYEQRGALDYQAIGADEYIDIALLTNGGKLRSMCEGENEGEILVTAQDISINTGSNSRVWRVCIPNTAGCVGSATTMLTGFVLIGIVKVEDTFLVAEQGLARVLQCPMGWCCQRSERREEV